MVVVVRELSPGQWGVLGSSPIHDAYSLKEVAIREAKRQYPGQEIIVGELPKKMRFTDEKILAAHAKISKENSDPSAVFHLVCDDVLGYNIINSFIRDKTEYEAFQKRYYELIR